MAAWFLSIKTAIIKHKVKEIKAKVVQVPLKAWWKEIRDIQLIIIFYKYEKIT